MTAKKTKAKKITLDDPVLWAISRRSRLFLWTPIQVFDTQAKALEFLEYYEDASEYGSRGYKVDRVELITKTLDEVVESLEAP